MSVEPEYHLKHTNGKANLAHSSQHGLIIEQYHDPNSLIRARSEALLRLKRRQKATTAPPSTTRVTVTIESAYIKHPLPAHPLEVMSSCRHSTKLR